MIISAVISSYLIDDGKPALLKKCVGSLRGQDETIVFAHKGMGFCEAWNTAASLAGGDFLIFIGDNTSLDKGNLTDLPMHNAVTCPLINSVGKGFSAPVFCLPRDIYEKYGLYDMVYNEGIHFMDDDLHNRLLNAGIEFKTIESVNFYHPEGGRTIDRIPDYEDKVQRNLCIFMERWKV